MKTHQDIDKRSLAMARAIALRIDRDPRRRGLTRARSVCARWYGMNPQPCVEEWMGILRKPWREARKMLLNRGELGQRLRQSSPFCGILTPVERWRIYAEYSEK